MNIIFSLLLSISIGGLNKATPPARPLFEIHFQNQFINDTLNLTINDCEVISGQILKSNPILSYTGFKVAVFKQKKNKHFLKVVYKGQTTSCPKTSEPFIIRIKINGTTTTKNLNLNDGIYFGVDKATADDSVIIRQSKNPFYYY